MIAIKNIELANLIKAQLNVSRDYFTEEELSKIEEITLSTTNYADEHITVDLMELKYFSGLKVLCLRGLLITSATIEILEKLKELKELELKDCRIDADVSLVKLGIDTLKLSTCDIPNDDFIYAMNYLRRLEIVGSYVDMSKLNKFYLLKILNVSSSIIDGVEDISLPVLEELILDYANIENLGFLRNIPTLKIVSLSAEQIDANKEIVRKLQDRSIEVWENSIRKVGEDI